MKDRFTRRSRVGRGKIPKDMRREVFARDENKCVYCGREGSLAELTIDHLIPIAGGGLDEMTNWATCCRPCNERKAAIPLAEFLKSLGMEVSDIPIHGDPIIDNRELPFELRAIRSRIIRRIRGGEMAISGTGAQKKNRKGVQARILADAGGEDSGD